MKTYPLSALHYSLFRPLEALANQVCQTSSDIDTEKDLTEAKPETLRLALPGIPKESIKVEYQESHIQVNVDHEGNKRAWEYFVPYAIDPTQVKAEHKDGLLTITVPIPVKPTGVPIQLS